ncbi:tellurite resistance/C4-dicarboxylate transporter family protein [Streptomyces sp. NPDC007264]|uniref:tellurite resistance/C4-dicarboxylate transporter family protein n=1 Tax=Streptomyces sp. NPDC007264 TaxID=3364777 RepID=UPI0036D8D653
MSGTSALRTRWVRRPPATGGAVLATGVLSVGLHLAGYEVLSRIALALACAAWLGLVADVAVRLLWVPGPWEPARAGSPTGLTPVAASAVLGVRVSLLGLHRLAEALLALALALWVGLVYPVLRRWERRRPGAVFLGCVATQGISALGAVLAAATDVAWLAHLALVLFWLGLVLYLVGLWRFDPRQVLTGAGDHWIAGGGLAVSALAGSRLVAAAHRGPYLWNDDDNGVLRAATVALLVLTLAWSCVLLVAEALRPRLGYDALRWATVFALGMTAAATLSVASSPGVPWLRGPGRVLLWIAVAVWCVVLAGAARAVARGLRPPGEAEGVRPRAPR